MRVRVNLASRITAPEASLTVPCTVAPPPLCARAEADTRRNRALDLRKNTRGICENNITGRLFFHFGSHHAMSLKDAFAAPQLLARPGARRIDLARAQYGNRSKRAEKNLRISLPWNTTRTPVLGLPGILRHHRRGADTHLVHPQRGRTASQ